ncbi:MAG: HEAT repeat domain-containing protein [Planctomycetaceae bacterium]
MPSDHRILVAAVCMAGAACLAGCGRSEPPPDVNDLITLLRGETDDDRYRALAKLQDLGADGREAVPELKTMLGRTKDDDLAAEIAKTLGEMGPTGAAAVPELRNLLARKAMWPRYAAVDALGRMGPAAAPALPAILALTKDPDREVAAAAAQAARRLRRSLPKK